MLAILRTFICSTLTCSLFSVGLCSSAHAFSITNTSRGDTWNYNVRFEGDVIAEVRSNDQTNFKRVRAFASDSNRRINAQDISTLIVSTGTWGWRNSGGMFRDMGNLSGPLVFSSTALRDREALWNTTQANLSRAGIRASNIGEELVLTGTGELSFLGVPLDTNIGVGNWSLNPTDSEVLPVSEPLTILGSILCLGTGFLLKRKNIYSRISSRKII